MKTIGKILIFGSLAVIAFVFIVVAIAPNTPNAVSPEAQTQASAATPAPATQAPAYVIPQDEQNFVNIIGTFIQQYGQAANDMQKGAVRTARRAAICSAFPSMHVKDWVGSIATLDSTDKGNGVLGVSLNENLTVTTNNNDLSDSLGTATTIPESSPLFAIVSKMKTGDAVIFSGDFQPSDNDCFDELSLTTDGGMQQPEFEFKFTNVKAATSNN